MLLPLFGGSFAPSEPKIGGRFCPLVPLFGGRILREGVSVWH